MKKSKTTRLVISSNIRASAMFPNELVKLIGLNSSILTALGFFGMGVTIEIFQALGRTECRKEKRNINIRGLASPMEHLRIK